MSFSYKARMRYYRLVRQARQVYDPHPKRLQKLVGVAVNLFPVISPLPKNVRKQQATIGEVPVEILNHTQSRDGQVRVLFLHGGAFVFGSPKTHRPMAGWLTKELQCETVVPDYDLAPKHQYPHQLDQVLSVYLAMRQSPGAIVVAGDSAGGNLAVVLAQECVRKGIPTPEALVLFSPWLDLRDASAAATENREEDSLFNAQDMCQYALLYAGESDRSIPQISPVMGESKGLPPTFLQGAENEFLWPDFEEWLETLEAEGIRAQLDAEPVAFHSWQLFPAYSSQARASLEKAAKFIQSVLD